MLDLHYWPTPNGHKITMFLEEAGLPYRIVPVNIGRGDQHRPEYLKISPNSKMPSLVDSEPTGGGAPFAIFESGAILLYLAEKAGGFLPTEPRGRSEVMQWLFWQVAGLGPMVGQAHHFRDYAPEKIPYAIDRYTNEAARLFGVLEARLAVRDFVAGDYSIADMAIYPWTTGQGVEAFPQVKAWLARIAGRPATVRAYAVANQVKAPKTLDDEARRHLFGVKAAKGVSSASHA